MSMACAAPSTKETTNYARLCRLLVDIGTQALRDTFNNIISPANLQSVLAREKSTIHLLKSRKIINPTQWGKLFPAILSSVSSASFDITLIMVLLRNICGLAAPASGWDALPVKTDVSPEADIARVKYYRNAVFAHAERASVDDATFNRYWSEIRDTLIRLGGVPYQVAVDNLETECMDPDVEEHYKELLRQWKNDEDNVKNELKEISTDIKTLTKKIDVLVESTLTSKKETIAEGEIMNLPMLLDTSLKCGEKDHNNELLTWFCEQCKVCICDKCEQTRHSHHIKVDIDIAAKQYKNDIAEIVKEMKRQITDFQVSVDNSEERTTESRKKIAKVRSKVLSSIEELVRVLREHETRTITKLDIMEETELRGCKTQLEHFQTSIEHLQNSVEYCQAILQRNESIEILQGHQDLIERCTGLLQAEKLNLNNPLHTVSHTRYEINEELVESVRRGEVPGRLLLSKTDPVNSVAEGKGLNEAEAESEARFEIRTQDSDRKPCYDAGDQVIVKVQSPSGEGLQVNLSCHHDGTYNVTYTPDCAGQHEVEIEINGQPLNDTPWRVQVSHHFKYLMSFGSRGTAQGQFASPSSIAIDSKTGNIAVADRDNSRVQVFSSKGKYLKTVSAKQLIQPCSVAFTSIGDLIVIALRKIFCFNESGKLVSYITSKHLVQPHRLSVSRDGRMVVSDWGDNTIKVLTPDGTQLLHTISNPADRKFPHSAICHQDTFILSYSFSHNVKVYSKQGVLLNSIGTPGSDDGQLDSPAGLAIDRFGNLVVCDFGNRRLQIFTLDGKLVTKIEGSDNGLQGPWSVAASTRGELFVTDLKQHCVYAFR